jgi:putative transposase
MRPVKIGNRNYWKVPVGEYLSKNYPEIVDERLIRLNKDDAKYNYYTYPDNKKFFTEKNPTKKFLNNHFEHNGKYISKQDTSIINGFYLFVPVNDIIIKKTCFMEIYPKNDGLSYGATFSYKIKPPPKLKNKNYASIDLGMRSLITMFSLNSDPIILSGGPCKSINCFYDRIIDETKSIAKTNGVNKDFKLLNMYRLKKNKMNAYFHKVTNYIVNTYCKSNNISLIVIGYNKGWKQKSKMGKKNNRHFQEIPYAKLVGMLEDKCEKNGIRLERQEEAYTSKCDALAEETIGWHEKYSGVRVKGTFITPKSKYRMNADVNGAMNIMRKYNKRIMKENDETYDMKIEARIKESLKTKKINIFSPKKILFNDQKKKPMETKKRDKIRRRERLRKNKKPMNGNVVRITKTRLRTKDI